MLEQQARNDLLVFAILTNPKYDVNWHHRIMGEKLQAVERGEIKRLILELPPRHGKSLLASILFPAWFMGRNPDKEIITASYNSDLAQDFGGKTRALVDDPVYHNIFNLKLAKDEKAKAKWKTSGGGTYTSVGIGGAITGRGADILIIDDPIKNREEADSDLIRAKHWAWFTSTAYTRLEPDAAIILILCMTGDTKVMMADKTEKKLCDVRVGDKVSTYNNGKLVVSTVKNWRSNGHDSVLKITTSCGKIVRANKRHPFLTYYNKQLKWTQVKNLTTAHKIVTLKDSGENGKENFVLSAINQQNAEDTVCLTTVKKCGLMDTARHLITKPLALLQKLNTGMELLLMSLMRLMSGKMASALYVNNHQQSIMCERTGEVNSVLTTVMKLEKSGRCFATTATSQSHIQKPLKLPPQLQNTSDFILEDIVSIEVDGIKEVFDLQVDGTENFIANGVVSHNTHWHFDDLAGRLIENEKNGGQKWEVVKFPAIAESDDEFRKAGEPLWANHFNLTTLEETRKMIGLMDWAALFQQNPIISESQEFREEYFRYFDEAELEEEHLTINILIDPAISKRDQACNTGFIDVAKKKHQPFWYVMDDCSGKMDPGQITAMVFNKVEQYERDYPMANVKVWIETIAFQEAYLYFFKEEMRRRERYFNIGELKNRQDKHGRIRGLIPLYKQGIIKHRHYMSKGPLEMELLQFPFGKLVDRIDALAFNLTALSPTVTRKRTPYRPLNPQSLTGW